MQISCQVSWMGYFTTCFLLLYPIATSSTTNPIPITPHPPIYLHIHMNCFNVILINITMIQLAHNTMNRHTTLHFNNIMTKKFLNSLLNVRVEFCRIITKDYNRYLWSAWSISNDTPNTYSVFSCTAVAIRYENQVQTLFWWPVTPYLGQLLPCHCTRPVLWTGHFGSNTPIIAGSDVGSHSHAEDTLKTESSQLWAGAWFCSKNHVDNVLKKSWQPSLLSILSILFLWTAK